MSRLSIKVRVTLFYTVAMILLLALTLAFLFLASDYQLTGSSHRMLESAVKQAGNQVEFEEDYLQIDPEIDLYPDGVTLVLYGPEGTPLLGTPPAQFPADTPLVSDQFQEVSAGETRWQVYDLYIAYGASGLWIRGIGSLSSGQSILRSIVTLSLVALPLFILLALAGGYAITRRAFRPVQEIVKAAEAISSGSDLTRRIGLAGNEHDEISALGHAFDEMFARLEESFNRERQFASDASHELRTPIAAILTQCEYALSLPEDNAEQRMCLERIQRQAKRMSTLVSQLLELTRADQQRAAIRRESFDLSELIEVVLEQMEPQAQACGIEFRTRLKPNLSFFGDPSLMMRLILNLVSNAIQYGRSGGFVLVSLTDDGRQAELRVEDNGIGIAPEHTPHIFERFYRADPSRSAQSGSSGLGLSMVAWIVKAHGGTVGVSSTLGVGTTFTVTLPLSPP